MSIKLKYKVHEIMDEEFIKINYKEKTSEAIKKLIFSKRDEVVLVNEKNKIVGLFTRTDIHRLGKNSIFFDLPVSQFSSMDIFRVAYDEDAIKARDLML